jgi:hypothetical protein
MIFEDNVKSLIVVLDFVIIGIPGLAIGLPVPTPGFSHAKPSVASLKTSKPPKDRRFHVHPKPTPSVGLSSPSVNARIRSQFFQIQVELKKKKITAAQASALKVKVQNIRMQENQMLKLSGKNTITDAQKAELNQALDQNQRSL